MKPVLIPFIALTLLFVACKKEDDDILTPQDTTPVVKQMATYEVNFPSGLGEFVF